MKNSIVLFLFLVSILIFSQEYSFENKLVNGIVYLKNGTELNGKIKWFPNQNIKLKFVNESQEEVKYSAEEVNFFSIDDLRFASVGGFDAYAANYAFIGTKTKIEKMFAQVIHEGSFNIYLAIIIEADPVGGGVQRYSNFLFENRMTHEIYAYPFLLRMKDKKYEKPKDNLYLLFKDYPEIIEKIKKFQKQNDFLEIVESIKNIK